MVMDHRCRFFAKKYVHCLAIPLILRSMSEICVVLGGHEELSKSEDLRMLLGEKNLRSHYLGKNFPDFQEKKLNSSDRVC